MISLFPSSCLRLCIYVTKIFKYVLEDGSAGLVFSYLYFDLFAIKFLVRICSDSEENLGSSDIICTFDLCIWQIDKETYTDAIWKMSG